jgi:hypothetical protein
VITVKLSEQTVRADISQIIAMLTTRKCGKCFAIFFEISSAATQRPSASRNFWSPHRRPIKLITPKYSRSSSATLCWLSKNHWAVTPPSMTSSAPVM